MVFSLTGGFFSTTVVCRTVQDEAAIHSIKEAAISFFAIYLKLMLTLITYLKIVPF